VAKNCALDRSFEGWIAAQVGSIEAPTLLIIGDADIVRPEHTVEMIRLLAGGVNGDLGGVSRSRLAILPGTSHTGMLDRSDWLATMVVDFLASAVPERDSRGSVT
jgi:pimeloyl-ACP methyl ester carboxylesterase